MWRYNPIEMLPERRLAVPHEARDEAADDPSHFDTTDFSKFLQVSKDKLSLRYMGNGDHETDVGSIQANAVVPTRRRVYYYEVTIIDAGAKGLISIGFAERGFNLAKHPGSEHGSYGYHSETGNKCNAPPSQQRGQDYGEPYSTGDTVGAGIILERQELFFTKNGRSFGKAFQDVLKSPLYPTVGLHSRNEHVVANFGAKPFEFDLDRLIHEERMRQTEAMQSEELDSGLTHAIVHDYLRHYAYANTLEAFERSTGLTGPEPGQTTVSRSRAQVEQDSLETRHSMRKHIMSGDTREVLKLLQNPVRNPTVAGLGQKPAIQGARKADVEFFLRCMEFLELLRNQKLEEAVRLGQEHLSLMRGAFSSRSSQFDAMLKDVVALLAYVNPEASPMALLMHPRQREYVADMVNEALIAAELEAGDSKEQPLALLQQCLLQLGATREELHIVNNCLGSRFSLAEHLHWLSQRPLRRSLGQRSEDSANGLLSMDMFDSANGH